MMKLPISFVLLLFVLPGCYVGNKSFSPARKYSPDQLKEDYHIYRKVLETHHPSLYWYTPKDSMDYYFAKGEEQLKDSMTEPQFRKVLNYVTEKIDCGHTSVRASKKWSRYSDTLRVGKLFPLSVKVWDSAMVVTTNLSRRDTVLKRGTVITGINGRSWRELTDTMFKYISADGHNLTSKFQSLSNRGYFGSMYTSLFGLSEYYDVRYLDNRGTEKTVRLPVFDPAKDTAGRRPQLPGPAQRISKKERKELQLNSVRLLKIDTVSHTAMMDLASFSRGYGLRRVFRNSYETLNAKGIDYLIIDVRSNGGGSIGNSTLATRYLVDHRFKIADTLFAVRKHSPWVHYVRNHFWNNLFIAVFTGKRKDGHYHFGFFEKHHFRPKKDHHYNGKVYLLTGGNSFSATTLFVSALVKQDNVTVIGEETGGGAYGNSAWLIPDVTLPRTGVRFRLPLFRLVIDKTVPKIGRGVQPEVPSFPTIEAVRRNTDYKLQKAMELIRIDKEASGRN